MSSLPCPACRFDLASLPIDVPPSGDEARDRLSCPVCKATVPLGDALAQAGVFPRGDGTLCRWGGGADAERSVRVGTLRIGLPQIRSLAPADVFFAAVPALLERDGTVRVPELPVRPEHLDLVAAEGFVAGKVEHGQYVATVRLKGQPRAQVVSRPLALQGRQIRGLRLALWPDVPGDRWRLHLVGAWLHGGDPGLDGRTLHVRAVGPGRAAEGSPLGAEGDRSVRQIDARPTHVAVILRRGEVEEAGGCFAVPAAKAATTHSDVAELGLDFGTSNSHVALRLQSAAEEIRNSEWWAPDLDLVLVNGTGRPDPGRRPETWPPPEGFEPHRSTFPSALLTAQPVATMGASTADWRPFEHVGFPALAGELSYDEAPHLIRGLKWRPYSSTGPFPDGAARQRYVELLLLMVLAKLAAEPTVLFDRAHLHWSYPLAFDDALKQSQLADLQAAARRVAGWTGIPVTVAPDALDEATVAGSAGASGRARDWLFVDVGGGSVDVLFLRNPADGDCSCHARASFRFAGEDYLDMLAQGSFLAPGLSRESFVRQIRGEKALGGHLWGRWIVSGQKGDVAQRRSEAFYGFLVEYTARLVAARLLDGSLEDIPDERPYEVSICLLGNAWSFLDLLPVRGAFHYVAQQVRERVTALCEASLAYAHDSAAYRRGVRAAVDVGRDPKIHPKEVVARGLLKGSAVATDRIDSYGVLGLNTRSEDGTLYPWFLPLVPAHDPYDKRLMGRPAVGKSTRPDWRDGDDPGFGKLPRPNQVDPELKKTYGAVRKQVFGAAMTSWFQRSALEVFMEELYRPNLHNLPMRG